MSALVLGGLSQAAGCIIVSDDDPDVVETAAVQVTWDLVNGGDPAGCPAGATTAAINALRAGDADPYVFLYDCADGTGATVDEFGDYDLPLDSYDVWVDLTDDSGAVLYAQSELATINLDQPGELATAIYTIDVANGFFDVAWTLESSSGSALTCADVGGEDGVSVLSTISGTTEAFDDLFDCENGGGTTFELPIADYTVAVSIIDDPDGPGPQAGVSLGDADIIQTSIDYGNQFRDLGTVPIVVF
jgi:hypothetical protein